MKHLTGKVIWITGASSGIGEALAMTLAEHHTHLILSARNEYRLQEVAQKCEKAQSVLVLPLDLLAIDSFEEKFQIIFQQYTKIDILINNAGISQRSLAKDTILEVDRKIMDVNYFGTIALSKVVLPHFLKQKSGKFVVISSLVGKFGTPLRSSYAASKHALHGFFDSLRAEVWKDNIKVLIVCPGFVKTEVSINALTADGSKQNTMDNAQANGLSAENCAKVIVKAIRKEKEEILIGKKEKYGVYLKRFFPQLFSRIIKKTKVT